jgi:uncharacterized cupin superfamily protein
MKDQTVQEATTEETPHGVVVTSEGWFALNLADCRAKANPNSGTFLSFESREHPWSGTGVNVHILQPGQPACRYHQETGQEDFLVLAGECVLIVEEQERHLRQWDFVHCPSGTRHVFVGAGDGPCAILMIGDRPEPEELHYPVSEAAARYGEASVSVATDHPAEAYAAWPGAWEPTTSPWPIR